VRWTEQRHDLNGAALGAPSHWEAALETTIVPPAASDTIVSNPLGFYIEQLSWAQEQAG
jgi:type IV secretory pathway TrbF-like protein